MRPWLCDCPGISQGIPKHKRNYPIYERHKILANRDIQVSLFELLRTKEIERHRILWIPVSVCVDCPRIY